MFSLPKPVFSFKTTLFSQYCLLFFILVVMVLLLLLLVVLDVVISIILFIVTLFFVRNKVCIQTGLSGTHRRSYFCFRNFDFNLALSSLQMCNLNVFSFLPLTMFSLLFTYFSSGTYSSPKLFLLFVFFSTRLFSIQLVSFLEPSPNTPIFLHFPIAPSLLPLCIIGRSLAFINFHPISLCVCVCLCVCYINSFLFPIFFVYIPSDFPFPSSLLPISPISPLPSALSPINTLLLLCLRNPLKCCIKPFQNQGPLLPSSWE